MPFKNERRPPSPSPCACRLWRDAAGAASHWQGKDPQKPPLLPEGDIATFCPKVSLPRFFLIACWRQCRRTSAFGFRSKGFIPDAWRRASPLVTCAARECETSAQCAWLSSTVLAWGTNKALLVDGDDENFFASAFFVFSGLTEFWVFSTLKTRTYNRKTSKKNLAIILTC